MKDTFVNLQENIPTLHDYDYIIILLTRSLQYVEIGIDMVYIYYIIYMN